jgi:hypothetical protein
MARGRIRFDDGRDWGAGDHEMSGRRDRIADTGNTAIQVLGARVGWTDRIRGWLMLRVFPVRKGCVGRRICRINRNVCLLGVPGHGHIMTHRDERDEYHDEWPEEN